MPFFSEMNASLAVLLPVYNAEKYLRECLDSILSQTVSDFELFVCDDGSTDGSFDILQEYAAKHSRIHVLSNPRNLGIVATRNHLLSAVSEKTDFIAWIDADDVMFPDRLRRQREFLESHPGIGGVGSSLEIIDEGSRVTGFRHYPETPEEIRRTLPRRNVLAQPALMIRRSLISQVGEYSSDCPVCQDYEYWLRCLEHSDFANLSEPLLHYRISSTQVKQSKLKQSLRITLQIQNEYFRRIGQARPFSLLIHHVLAHILLLFPSTWIMRLFVLLTYRKTDRRK